MRKIAIIFMELWMLIVDLLVQDVDKVKKVENRMVGNKEVDSMHWLDADWESGSLQVVVYDGRREVILGESGAVNIDLLPFDHKVRRVIFIDKFVLM